MMKVCLGGTFDELHKGHKILINKAFNIAGKDGFVFIGITSGILLKSKINVEPIEKRKQIVQNYLRKKNFGIKTKIAPIEDKYGPSIIGDFDAIVVSSETVNTAKEINQIRRKNGLKPLKIVDISMVLADNGKPISSTRIKKKEINENGKILDED